MAVFAKNTLTQVSGFDNPIIAGELVWEQQTYWNLALSSEEVPVNLVINDDSWDLISDDPELNIAIENCVCFTGRIKISFPAVEPTPAEDNIIFLMFLVRSDGVVVV